MNKPLTKEQRLDLNRKYLLKSIKDLKPTAYKLNVKLANNPFLKNEDKFQFLIYQLNEYNKRVEKQQVNDQYEMASYQKIYSMISDISHIQTKNDQVTVLHDVYQWYKEQNRLIQQRRNQGEIRYEMTNNYRQYTKIPQQNNKNQTDDKKQFQLPSELIDRLLQPFRWGNRTSHKQFDIPLRRLNEYKRKVINIAPFIQTKQNVQYPRVLYPMPPKYEPKQEQEQHKEGQEGQQNKEPIAEGQQSSLVKGQQGNQQGTGQPSQEIGGEDGDDPDEDEPPEQVQDKLAPKNKIFMSAITKPSSEKFYRGQYMMYKGSENPSQRSLEQRYLKLQEQMLVKQREDMVNVQLANERAKKKSKVVKEIQKKLQDMMHKPKFLFSEEEAKPQQKLSKQDQIKFGFTVQVRAKPKYNQFDLTNNTTLPRIQDSSFDQKSIRRDRIKSLKSKFSKLLNLTEYEERESSVSMCQYTARKRGFSQIIKHHSKSKERLQQLDEVTRIKQKLTRNKIGVNIRALSQGLCLPDSQQNTSQIPENMFANKELPSNPFMVETKKKKKNK